MSQLTPCLISKDLLVFMFSITRSLKKIDRTVEVKKGKIYNLNAWKGGQKYFSYRFDYVQLTGHGVLKHCSVAANALSHFLIKEIAAQSACSLWTR